jgi:hypothetical protein
MTSGMWLMAVVEEHGVCGVVDIGDVGAARVSSAEARLLSASERAAFNADDNPSTSSVIQFEKTIPTSIMLQSDKRLLPLL